MLSVEFAEAGNMPQPNNEPILGFVPGSQERADLQAEMDRQMGEVIEIPCIINGEECSQALPLLQVIPHNHGHILANVHLAGKAEMEAACREAAVNAQQAWIDIGLEEDAPYSKALCRLTGWRLENACQCCNNA